jgi:NAD(P)-dependent dehydrogenase (short-subunit alcohol dehydrogenase family)
MDRDRFGLTGKVALVTGGSRGIGRAIALGLAETGADVAVASRTLPDLEGVVQQIRDRGRRGLAVKADVSRTSDIETLAGRVLDAFGRVDVLVNSAGISPVFTSALKISETDWRHILDVNMTGTFLVTCSIGRLMVQARQGSIINLVSIGARVGLPRLVAYCASKAGVEAMTRVLALEWAEHGVRVNALGPAFVSTDMTSGLRDHPRLGPAIVEQTPLGRFATPDDIVGAAIYLASDASSYVTGQTLFVDGGWLSR